MKYALAYLFSVIILAGCKSPGPSSVNENSSTLNFAATPLKCDKCAAGERGERGLTGTPGQHGADGERGVPGPRGPAGLPGLAGARGQRGEQGVAGEKGDAGAKGDRGDKGDAGARGEPGEPGKRGAAGADGTNVLRPVSIIFGVEPESEGKQGGLPWWSALLDLVIGLGGVFTACAPFISEWLASKKNTGGEFAEYPLWLRAVLVFGLLSAACFFVYMILLLAKYLLMFICGLIISLGLFRVMSAYAYYLRAKAHVRTHEWRQERVAMAAKIKALKEEMAVREARQNST
ncbi:hypothetical protein [Janthinobacterium fluminis]|uniref:Collagen triple helix repeat-containing protein n=1 Tax=Janthinobacterium fluminis TaxID=2987524 RepID=A0ABT5JTB2_9BURK|nr:hypothetical protein [Janthinobacterium fluminis]MDC8755990.1 hypothetical protein [Janthinobacterium fluminis]